MLQLSHCVCPFHDRVMRDALNCDTRVTSKVRGTKRANIFYFFLGLSSPRSLLVLSQSDNRWHTNRIAWTAAPMKRSKRTAKHDRKIFGGQNEGLLSLIHIQRQKERERVENSNLQPFPYQAIQELAVADCNHWEKQNELSYKTWWVHIM